MPLYVCRFCDYTSKYKQAYYYHLYTHINENNASFDKEELELCKYYHNKINQYNKKYRQNNKDKIYQIGQKYRQNNKDKIYQTKKEYYQNNKEQISKYDKTYSQNYKDKILQRMKEYRQNNKDIISQRDKEYRLRKKLEKEEANILDVNDSD
jgi:hypothetical protein